MRPSTAPCLSRLVLCAAWLVLAGVAGAQTSPASAPTASAAASDPDGPALLRAFAAIDWSADEPAVPPAVGVAFKDSAALRQAGLDLLRSLPRGSARSNLLDFMVRAGGAPMQSAAVALAERSGSAGERALGFDLLARLLATPQTVALAEAAVHAERDAALLAAALPALQRQDIPPPAQVARLTPRLHQLTWHADARVRAMAVQRLAEWDRNLRYAASDILRLSADADADVRVAAVGAVSLTRATSPRIKQRLLQLLSDPQQHPDVRLAAQMNLTHFDLDEREHAAYERAISQPRGGLPPATTADADEPSPQARR